MSPKKENKKERLFYRFLSAICKMNPVEFYGIAEVLQVKVKDLQDDTEKIVSEVIDAFIQLQLPIQKAILGIAENAVKVQNLEQLQENGEKKNG